MLNTISGDVTCQVSGTNACVTTTVKEKRWQSDVDANTLASQFFSMPHISPDPNYCDRGNTKVIWTAGLFDLVKFEAWDSFDEIWHDGMEAFRKLSETQKGTVKLLLDSARAIVSSDNREDEKLRILQRKRKRGARRLYRDYSSISAIVSNVVSAIENLLREDIAECGSDTFVQCEKECRVSSEFITLDSGEKLHFVLPQSLISDVGVVVGNLEAIDVLQIAAEGTDSESEFENGVRIMPVCHFEMKGPTLDLAGVQQTKKVQEKLEEHSATNAGPAPGSCDPSNCDASNHEGGTEFPGLSTVQLTNVANKEKSGVQQSERCENPVRDQRLVPYTAAEVAESLNFMFSDPKFLDTQEKIGGPIRDSIYRVAQVVISAVLSLGSCAYLYNFESGIAFKVDGVRDGKLLIKVTGVMTCDGSRNNISAMSPMAKHCIDEYFEGVGTPGFLDRLRSNALSVGINAVLMKDQSPESSHEEYNPAAGEDINDSRDSRRECKERSVG